jgi:hypothetical protein
MESDFVFITRRHELMDGRAQCGHEATPTSRARGWNDPAPAVRGGQPFGSGTCLRMTHRCHASQDAG